MVLLFNTGGTIESVHSESVESSNVFILDLRNKMSEAVVQMSDNNMQPIINIL